MVDPNAGSEPARRLESTLFGLALAIFFASRLIGLADFPIYFFCDEAVHSVRAGDLLRNGLRDEFGRFLPTYFQNAGFFNLSTSVYLQVPLRLLFDNSVFLARLTTVLAASLGTFAVGLLLKHGFRLRFPWTGILLLSITPSWFLHSRTAFETVLATSFYAGFLYFYVRYRSGGVRYVFPSLLCGALAFYSYSPMQVVVVLTGALLLLLDVSFHWRNRRAAAAGLVFLVLLALPHVRFLRSNPNEAMHHLRQIFSYWTDRKLDRSEKVARYGREYTAGLSPLYWYGRDSPRDLDRHKMKGYGHILWMTAPFALGGVLICLRRFRSPPYRTAIVAALAAPTGGALVQVGITRALVFVIPAAIFTATGLDAVLVWLARRVSARAVALGAFAALFMAQAWMVADALAKAPTWYRDYGLGGMQFGARQVYGETRRYLARDRAARMVISPDWTNGAEDVRRFFVGDDPRVELHNLDWYLVEKRKVDENLVVVLPPDEYRRAQADPRLANVRFEKEIPYPDGSDGFRFLRFNYAPDVDARMAALREVRHRPVRDSVAMGRDTVDVAHSRLDMGPLAHLFDGDPRTLIRTEKVNPAVVDIEFRAPRMVRGITLTTGSMEFDVTVAAYAPGEKEPSTTIREFRAQPPDPTVVVTLDAPGEYRRLRIEVRNIHSGDEEHIHLRDLTVD